MNTFLQFWHRIQMRKQKYPLSFVGSKGTAKVKSSLGGKSRKVQGSQAKSGAKNEEVEDGENKGYEPQILPVPPSTVADQDTKAKRWYLRDLDNNKAYQHLVQLLLRTLVHPSIYPYMKEAYPCVVDVQPGETRTNHGQPSWATWKNIEPYLPPVFYDIHGGVSSLRGLFSWLRMDPITTQDGRIHGYE